MADTASSASHSGINTRSMDLKSYFRSLKTMIFTSKGFRPENLPEQGVYALALLLTEVIHILMAHHPSVFQEHGLVQHPLHIPDQVGGDEHRAVFVVVGENGIH